MPRTPRVLFLGTRCTNSAGVLASLVGAGFEVRVVVPGPPGQSTAIDVAEPHREPGSDERRVPPEPVIDASRPLRRPLVNAGDDPLSTVAAGAGFPINAAPTIRRPDRWASLVGDGVDLIVTACFPWRVPAGLVALAPLGGVNVHPSLLPLGRGPHPVFWTVRRGERMTGVTIHLLTETFDAGPILAKAMIPTPTDPPLAIDDLERRLFRLGGEMLPGVLRDLAAGTAMPEPQDHTRATDAPTPGPADYLVPTTLPAAWAYRFTRAVRGTGPTTVLIGATGEAVPVTDALALGPADLATAPVVRRGATVIVRFLDGTMTFATAPTGGPSPECPPGPVDSRSTPGPA